MAAASRAIDLGTLRKNRDVVAAVALARRDEADAAVLMVVVVPADESRNPAARVDDVDSLLRGALESLPRAAVIDVCALYLRENDVTGMSVLPPSRSELGGVRRQCTYYLALKRS